VNTPLLAAGHFILSIDSEFPNKAFCRSMGKKKKKKHKADQKPKTAQPLERQAPEYLAAGRFRQAVDAYKELFKKDPDTYRPHLRASYEGLYKRRLQKGMVQEAAMVLDQIEKLAGDMPCAESIRLWCKRQQFAKAAQVAADVLGAAEALPGQDAALVADALITSFDEMPRPTGLSDPIIGDQKRIQSALKAVAEQSYALALETIKPIGLRSIFISWKWLIKGLCAFYAHEDGKALAAFEKIVAGTVPGAFAAPYARLLANNTGEKGATKEPAALEAVCAAAGYETIAPAIARADYLWNVQRFRDSHVHLMAALDSFPNFSNGLERTLTQLYYNAVFEMPFEQAQKYIRHLADSAFRQKNDNPIERLWAQRTVALYTQVNSQADGPVMDRWEEFIGLYALIYGESPTVRALVYHRLGDFFATQAPDDMQAPFFFGRRRRKRPIFRNPELARRCYEKSLEANPDAKDNQLSLIRFYETNGDAGKVNKLLDRLVKQFPGEKDVLFKAGQRCLERKALLKAMGYLEQALALDPMDKMVRENFILACITAARNYASKRQAVKSRELLPRVIDASDAHSDDFNRGRAYLYLRWAAFEQLNGDSARAEAMWAQAKAQRPGGETKLHYFYWILARHYGVPSRSIKTSEELVRKSLKAPVDVATAVDFADTLLYVRRLPESHLLLAGEIYPIYRYIARAVKLEMTRPQARSIMTYALSDCCESPEIAVACADKMLQCNPGDAYFRYYRYLARQEDGRALTSKKELDELKTILQLAREQQENTVAIQVQKRLKELEAADPFAPGNSPFGDMLDEDELDEDELPDELIKALMNGFRPPRRSSSTPRRSKSGKKKSSPPGPQQLDLF
jgi:tetratricopeptide (TPR) repeat protein